MNTGELILHSRALAIIGSDGFDTDEDLDAWLAQVDALAISAGDKCLARRHVATGIREQAGALRGIAEQILERAKRAEAEAERVDAGTLALVQATQESTGVDRVKMADGGWCKAQVRRSLAVEVTCDATALPVAFQRVKCEADRVALKKALESGESIDGVQLVSRESISLAWSK